jgi:predicted metal-dependent HD superfamily phosphohydrolase
VIENAPLTLPAEQWTALEAAYATPPRAYHSFDHVREVARHFDTVAQGPGWRQPGEVFVAVLYHDAIYVPGRKDNESRSAELAREHCGERWPVAGLDIARSAELIELTARHGHLAPDEIDAEAALFLDCDMAILGAEPSVFDAYDRAIAAEYRGRVPGWMFEFNRRRFLKNLLARERIFLSGFFHARLDAPARANLKRTIARARSPLRAGAGR